METPPRVWDRTYKVSIVWDTAAPAHFPSHVSLWNIQVSQKYGKNWIAISSFLKIWLGSFFSSMGWSTYQCKPWNAQVDIASEHVTSKKCPAFLPFSYSQFSCPACAGTPLQSSHTTPSLRNPNRLRKPLMSLLCICNLSQHQIFHNRSLDKQYFHSVSHVLDWKVPSWRIESETLVPALVIRKGARY